jgi:hypothetical protein
VSANCGEDGWGGHWHPVSSGLVGEGGGGGDTGVSEKDDTHLLVYTEVG